MKRFIQACTFLTVLLVGAAALAAGVPAKKAAALSAAEKWLAVVDGGDYGKSWQEASGYFRNAVSESKWDQSMEAFRKPLGKLVSRKVKSQDYTTSLPGAPDGVYVVIRFETSFAHKKQAIETVTPMLEKDGSWRVSGYFIK